MQTILIIDDDIAIGSLEQEVLPQIQDIPVIVVSAKTAVQDK